MRDIILDVQSIGYGVQSVGMALASGMDLWPRPDMYCYSDLPDSKKTKDYISFITPKLLSLGVDVQILKPADLYGHILSWPIASRISMIPVWFMGADGKRQPLNRQCTGDFKIEIVAAAVRERLGKKRLQRNTVRVWQGISLDEERRTKKKSFSLFPESFRVNHLPYLGHLANITYPTFKWESYSRDKIIEKLFKFYGIPVPPKSSCYFCPFHSIEEWFDLYTDDPAGWEAACVLDDSIRNYNTPTEVLVSGPLFLYEGLIPIREIDFDRERSKALTNQITLGCESGFCGF